MARGPRGPDEVPGMHSFKTLHLFFMWLAVAAGFSVMLLLWKKGTWDPSRTGWRSMQSLGDSERDSLRCIWSGSGLGLWG